MSLDSHEWAKKKLGGAIDEYVKGVWARATYAWVLGELHFALEKMNVSKAEIEEMLSKQDKLALQYNERSRLNSLKEALSKA